MRKLTPQSVQRKMPEFCFVVQKRYKKMMYKAYK